MKHIRRYDKIDSKIEELSEYLQEFFDKHNITQVIDESKAPSTDFYWIMYPTYISICGKTNGIPFYESYHIYKDLLNLKSQLEKRLSKEIDIIPGFTIDIMLR